MALHPEGNDMNDCDVVKRAIFEAMWNLLNDVMTESETTLWANGETTAHEALTEIALDFMPEVGREFEKRLEQESDSV